MSDPAGGARLGALHGQVAVVTGASQGIGRRIALRAAEEGASVVLAARTEDKLQAVAAEVAERGAEALVVPTDLREPASVMELHRRAIEAFGRVDALVCNAGIAGPTAEAWNVTLDDWEDTFRVNVTGTFLCCRAFLPGMLERARGSVVVIGSMSGKRPLYGRTPYTASKMALVGLVRTLAWEAGTQGVRVNLVSPGATDGPRVRRVLEAQAQARGITVEAAFEEMCAASPLQRLVSADDVAAAVVFLASDAAAAITGDDLNASAGAAMY
jgi:NAD(P)-dependent dehydrogenase (short-subunit alcohol dehydrogenase family)